MNASASSGWLPGILRIAPDSMWRRMEACSANPRLQLMHFLWSLWVLATVFFAETDAAFWWSVGIGYSVFALLFVLAHIRPFDELRVYAGLMAMLAMVSMLWNPAAWAYAVFGCVYTGIALAEAPRAGVLRMVMILSMVLALAWWLDWPWFVMVMAAGVCLSSGVGAMLGFRNQTRSAQLRQSYEEVRRLAAAAERERIGRDLHDLLGHTLSLITLKLELSRRLFDRDHAAARRELEDAEAVARQALAEVRTAVRGMRAADLAAELASARLLLQSSGVEFEWDGSVPGLSADIERQLAMLLREAVTNVARHARARRVTAMIRAEGGNVLLRVVDDGRGGVDGEGNGLIGMRERVRALGGVLRIDSPRGHGTALEVLIPCHVVTAAAKADTDTDFPLVASEAGLTEQHA